MEDETTPNTPKLQTFLEELRATISHPYHRRLLDAYQGNDPVAAMERELSQILLEVLLRENQ